MTIANQELRKLFEDIDRIAMNAKRHRSHPDDIKDLQDMRKQLDESIFDVMGMVRKSLESQGLFISPGSKAVGINDKGMLETFTVVGIKSGND